MTLFSQKPVGLWGAPLGDCRPSRLQPLETTGENASPASMHAENDEGLGSHLRLLGHLLRVPAQGLLPTVLAIAIQGVVNWFYGTAQSPVREAVWATRRTHGSRCGTAGESEGRASSGARAPQLPPQPELKFDTRAAFART